MVSGMKLCRAWFRLMLILLLWGPGKAEIQMGKGDVVGLLSDLPRLGSAQEQQGQS